MRKTQEQKWGIDTHFLVYLLDRCSPYHLPTLKWLDKMNQTKISLYLAQQNILETHNVLINTNLVNPQEAIAKTSQLVDFLCLKIVCPLPTTLNRYQRLIKNTAAKDIFDLYLAATLIDNQIKKLFTLNTKDFKKVTGFQAVKPF